MPIRCQVQGCKEPEYELQPPKGGQGTPTFQKIAKHPWDPPEGYPHWATGRDEERGIYVCDACRRPGAPWTDLRAIPMATRLEMEASQVKDEPRGRHARWLEERRLEDPLEVALMGAPPGTKVDVEADPGPSSGETETTPPPKGYS